MELMVDLYSIAKISHKFSEVTLHSKHQNNMRNANTVWTSPRSGIVLSGNLIKN